MEKNIELIAQWWADKVTAPSLNWDNGDNSQAGGLTFMLANMLAQQSRNNAPSDAPEKFKAALIKGLKDSQTYQKSNGTHIPFLNVDYHPCEILAQAAAEAGIDASAFPCKSSTQVIDGKALAACGYGAKSVCLND
jgi:2-methylcitrate dehydratase PrpD